MMKNMNGRGSEPWPFTIALENDLPEIGKLSLEPIDTEMKSIIVPVF
jgi:hypothetical protein